MLKQICPKLPMRNKSAIKHFYLNQLGFVEVSDYGDYLLLRKHDVELHFFQFDDLVAEENYGMAYIRVEGIADFYADLITKKVEIHPNGKLET